MEKKVSYKFYYLSALNVIPALILAGGFNRDALILIGALAVLVINHAVLVKMVKTLTDSYSGKGEAAGNPMYKVLFLFFLKMLLLGVAIGIVYFFNKALISKVLILIIFQLIIQVVSIKNNYQIS